MTQLQADSKAPLTQLVSVMMPAYNAEAHIAAAIDSVIAQTYTNWELVVVDDGSTDGTRAVIERYAAADARIKPIFAPHGGRGRARNICVSHCQGEFVAMLDSDDVTLPTRFERQVQFLTGHPHIGAVSGQCCSFTTTPVVDPAKAMPWPQEPEAIRNRYLNGKMGLVNGAAMVRRKLFDLYGGYDERLLRAQDYEFFRRLVLRGVGLAALPDIVLLYRQENLIPSAKYFVESQMFHRYAHYLMEGGQAPYVEQKQALSMRLYEAYLRTKYIYFFLKLKFMYRNAH